MTRILELEQEFESLDAAIAQLKTAIDEGTVSQIYHCAKCGGTHSKPPDIVHACHKDSGHIPAIDCPCKPETIEYKGVKIIRHKPEKVITANA